MNQLLGIKLARLSSSRTEWPLRSSCFLAGWVTKSSKQQAVGWAALKVHRTKLEKNPEIAEAYEKVIEEYLENNHIRRVPLDDLHPPQNGYFLIFQSPTLIGPQRKGGSCLMRQLSFREWVWAVNHCQDRNCRQTCWVFLPDFERNLLPLWVAWVKCIISLSWLWKTDYYTDFYGRIWRKEEEVYEFLRYVRGMYGRNIRMIIKQSTL